MQDVINLLQANATTHIVIFSLNILLFLLAAPIVKFINAGEKDDKQVKILRALNILFLSLHILDLIIVAFDQQHKYIFSNLGWTLVIIYSSFIFYSISGFYIRRKFGTSKKVDDKTVYTDSYNSRMMSVLVTILTTMIAIMFIIKLWELNSLLETTGVFGVIVAFLALTNGIWGPDLYYGLVILNSNMLEEGDVVSFDNNLDSIYIINKVNFVYTILLDVSNNHRILMRNAKMIDMSINNLTKKASMEGLLYKHTYKIGYPEFGNEALEGYAKFKKRVDSMFTSAQEEAFKNKDIKVNNNVAFRWMIKDTGDHALEYILIYHIASLPTTRSTKTVRIHLMSTPRNINELVYKASLEQGIDLSTPITLHQV
jgi:hypothetical protein